MRDAVENSPRNANVGNQKEVMESKKECDADGRRTERVPETPVRGKQATQMKPADEGNLGLIPREQGGGREIRKKRRTQRVILEVGPKDPIPEVFRTPL